MNLHPYSFPVAGLQNDFAALMLSLGILEPKHVREPRRWELREQGDLPPHSHLREKTKRREQLNRIEAKKRAAHDLNRRLGVATPSAVRRLLREQPYVYL